MPVHYYKDAARRWLPCGQILGGCPELHPMRKLLQLCYGVLKTGRPFDPKHGVGPGTVAA